MADRFVDTGGGGKWNGYGYFRVASELPTRRRALRASRRELSGNVAPRLLPHPAAVFMRRLLPAQRFR
jgi:hypothetical protein